MYSMIRHSILAAGLILGLLTEVSAQQKVGYVDTDYILDRMPEYEGIQQKLSAISVEWKQQLDKLDAEIKQLKADFEAKKVLYTEKQKEEKQQEIAAKKQARQQYMQQKFGSEGAYFKKQKKLLKPIQRTVFEAINAVADRGNFDFVFDRAENTGLLYGNEEFNLNEEVLQEIGITLKE